NVKVLYLGRSHNGVFAVLEDAYGNRFTYGHLRGLVRHYVRVRTRRPTAEAIARELRLDRGQPEVRRAAYRSAPDGARPPCPADPHSPPIDPPPVLEAWRLAARGAMGPTSSHTASGTPLGLGRTLLLSDHQLARMVLTDPRVHLTHAGRDDVRSGQIDRRVLISLEALADARLQPSVSALRSGPAGDAARALGRGFEVVALNGDRLGRSRTRGSIA